MAGAPISAFTDVQHAQAMLLDHANYLQPQADISFFAMLCHVKRIGW
jgi:hypothetical protein